MHKLIVVIREWSTQQGLIALSLIMAAILCNLPLQRLVALSRYQHYSYALAIVAVGLLLQAIVSWKLIGFWGRCAMVSATIFLGLCAWFFYSNPWLGNPDLATDAQLLGRQRFIVVLTAILVPVSYFWIRYGIANRSPRRSRVGIEEHQLK